MYLISRAGLATIDSLILPSQLKCTGQKTGCNRCSTKAITCVYSTSADSKGPKRRRRTQSSVDNNTSSSSPSSFPARTSKTAASQPNKVLLAENAPRMDESSSPKPYGENPGAQSRPNLDLPTAQNTEDCSLDSGFMELLDTAAMDVETTELDDGSTFKFSSSIDVDDLGHSPFLSGLSPFDPGVEDFFCFESDIETAEGLGRAGIALDNSRNLHKSHQTAGDSSKSSFEPPYSRAMPSTSYWPLPSPSTTLVEGPGQAQPLIQSHRQHAEPALSSENNMFESLSVPVHDTATSQPSSSACQCMQSALRILEELEVKNSRDDLYAADHVLSFQKRALGQCNAMLNCKNCSTISGFMMLLVVICDKMVTSFERVSTCVEQLQRPSGVQEVGRPRAGSIGDGQAVSLGDYEIDSLQERCCLVSVLVLLQLKRLGSVLTRLKNIAAVFNWGTHLTMLLSIDRRFQNTTANLHLMINDRTT